MSNKNIITRIALLEEQIDNLEKSGHFTEKEMDSQTFPLKQELQALQAQEFPLETVLGVNEDELSKLVLMLKHRCQRYTNNAYGMTPKSYNEGYQKHAHYFSQMPSPASELIKEIALQHVSYFPLMPSPALINTWNVLGMNQINRG